MTIKVRGLNLRSLNDKEYDQANALSIKAAKKSLDFCPTCGTKYDLNDENFDDYEKSRRYRYREDLIACDCKLQIALFARYLLAGIPPQYMRLNWDDYDGSPNARKFVDAYLDKWKGFRRYGFGVEFGGTNYGIGKTFAATHLGKELIKRKQDVFFVEFVTMVSAFTRSNSEALEDKIRDTPYVILDDIKPPFSDKQENLYQMRLEAIIRHRTNFDFPTIVTTNLSAEELEEYYPVTYSLLAAKQKRIDMDGEDFRTIMGLDNSELSVNDEVRPIT